MYNDILEVNRDTEVDATATGQKTCVNSLIERAVAAAHLGIRAQVPGNGEHVVCLAPYLQAKQPTVGIRNLIGKADVLQLEVATVLNPAVAHALVVTPFLTVGVASLRHVGVLTFIRPATQSCGCLVVGRVETLNLAALIVIDVVAERVLEVDIETKVLP